MTVTTSQKEKVSSDTNKRVIIPAHASAHLMYYLNCVCVVLNDLRDDPILDFSPLTEHLKFYSLDSTKKKQLFVVCQLFKPDLLVNQVFFEANDLGPIPNKFIELDANNSGFVVASEILIAGKARPVRKIMLFDSKWMQKYFYAALDTLQDEIKAGPHAAISGFSRFHLVLDST